MNVFEREEQPKAIGIWAGGVGLAIAIGPITGGLLLAALLVGLGLPGQRADRDRSRSVADVRGWCPDSKRPAAPAGSTRSACSCPSSAWCCSSTASSRAASSADFTDPRCWRPSAAGLAVLAALRACTRSAATTRRWTSPTSGTRCSPPPSPPSALVFFALMGVTFFSVFYTQSVRGYSPLQSGLLLLPLAAAQLIFAPRARLRRRPRSAPGPSCTGGMLAARRDRFVGFPLLDADTPIWVLEVLFFLMGTGMAHVMTAGQRRHHAGAAPREGRLRLRAEQHLPPGRRRARRRRPRLGAVHRLPQRHRGPPRRAAGGACGTRRASPSRPPSASPRKLGPRGEALVGPANDAFLHAMHVTALCGGRAWRSSARSWSPSFLPGRPKPAPADADKEQPARATRSGRTGGRVRRRPPPAVRCDNSAVRRKDQWT